MGLGMNEGSSWQFVVDIALNSGKQFGGSLQIFEYQHLQIH